MRTRVIRVASAGVKQPMNAITLGNSFVGLGFAITAKKAKAEIRPKGSAGGLLATLTEERRRTPPTPQPTRESMRGPNYEHDCAKCKSLGTTVSGSSGKVVDLYFCPTEPTIIARFSDEPSDYASGISFGKRGSISELHVAYERALQNGLIS